MSARPISGFADIHAHPMAHLGFGGHLVWGRPDGPVEEALAACDGANHGGRFKILGVDVAKMVVDGIGRVEREIPSVWKGPIERDARHPRDGYPSFRGWPFAGTIAHQQMHRDWLRRAYQGGLRLMSGLAVNNRLLAWLMEGRRESWDDETVRAQLLAMRAFARAPENRGWMEIAYSADDARRIAGAEDKLAIVLGVEVDQIELMISHDPLVLGQLENEAGRYLAGESPSAPRLAALAQTLHELGVRQVTPVHLADNAFGGAALYLDKTATNSHWLNLWRTGRASASGVGWPEVEEAPSDVEFRLQAFQLPANRTTFFLSKPIDDAVRVSAYGAQATGGHANVHGLTRAGVVLLLELWRRGILVDVDHMSARGITQALSLAERFDVPMISSHCWLRGITLDRAAQGMPADWWRRWDGRTPDRYSLPAWPMVRHEGMRTDDELRRLTALGGIVAPILRQPAVVKPDALRSVRDEGVELAGTTTAAAAAYLHVAQVLGGDAPVALATDMNGFAQSPAPSTCCTPASADPYGPAGLERLVTGERVWDVSADGLAHYGMLPDLLARWRMEGVSREQMAPLMRSADGYVDTWSRAEQAASRITRP
jgi:microsomal dipeptidase-like Zn-dependent dipeptidase